MGCCSKFGVIFLVIINLIFLVLSLAIIIPAIMMLASFDILTSQTKPVLESISLGGVSLQNAYSTLPISILVLGVIVLIISLIGLIGACCKFRTLLVIYAIIVMVFAVGELAIVIVFFFAQNKVEEVLKSEMISQLRAKYQYDDLTSSEISTAWNYLFMELECCAIENINEFAQTQWTGGSTKIPRACCKSVTVETYTAYSNTACTDSGRSTSEYHTSGCYQKIKEKLTAYFLVFAITGSVLFITQIIAITFAFVVCKHAGKVHDEEEAERKNRDNKVYTDNF